MPDMEEGAATQQPLLSGDRRERVRARVEEAKESLGDWWAAHATSTYALLTHMALCVLFGLLSALALKMFGKLILLAVIVVFILVQVLAVKGYVNLNWHQVSRAFKDRLDLNNDGRLDLQDMKVGAKRVWGALLSYGIPSVGGFALGFWWGMVW